MSNNPGKMVEWSPENIETFLRAYRSHRCLWDNGVVGFSLKSARNEALQSILDEMALPGMDIETLKRKIHSIRNAYTNERRKIEKSRFKYRPRSSWFYTADSFLRKIVASRRDRMKKSVSRPFIANMTSVNLQNLVSTSAEQLPNSPDESETTGSLSEASVCTYKNNDSINVLRYEPEVSNLYESHPSSSSGRSSQQVITVVAPSTIMRGIQSTTTEVKCKQESLDLDTIDEALVEQTTQSMIRFQDAEEDELDAFARSVLLQMRRLPEEHNIELMAQIQRLISDKRKEYLWSKK